MNLIKNNRIIILYCENQKTHYLCIRILINLNLNYEKNLLFTCVVVLFLTSCSKNELSTKVQQDVERTQITNSFSLKKYDFYKKSLLNAIPKIENALNKESKTKSVNIQSEANEDIEIIYKEALSDLMENSKIYLIN